MDAPELASFLMDFSDSHSTSAWAHAPAIPPSPPAVATENTTALPPTGGSNGLAKAPVSCTEPILPRRTRADYGPVTPENKDGEHYVIMAAVHRNSSSTHGIIKLSYIMNVHL